MSGKNNLGDQLLLEMHLLLEGKQYMGQMKPPDDLLYILEGSWLKDATVIDIVNSRDGAWDVYLIFAHYTNPLQLIVRNIVKCLSEQKERAAAFNTRKEAAKEKYGTLSIAIQDIHLCNN